MKTPDSRLRRLVDAWHDGTITSEDGLHLQQRLRDDETARRYFFEIAELEAGLPIAAADLPQATTQPAAQPTGPASHWRWAAVFVAGLFLGALAWLPVRLIEEPGPPTPAWAPVATITGMRGVTWTDDQDDASLTLAPNQRREIESGLIELGLDSGTRVLLEGPASFAATGANALQLAYGKLVADVPRGAEGFTVDYPDGEIIDLGTEFAAEVDRGTAAARFGVFRGEIECRPDKTPENAFRLLEGHAVLLEDGEAHSIPFNHSEFVRELPSREFSWEIGRDQIDRTTWEFDVSHLIYKPGSYRVICKLLNGSRTVRISGARLFRDDGIPAGEDLHEAILPEVRSLSEGNAYNLAVSPAHYRRGRWTLRMEARIDPEGSRAGHAPSSGIMLFEEGLVSNALAGDFIGTWEYLHDGKVFRRSFLPDGSASLTIDGASYRGFDDSRWRVDGGNLVLSLQDWSGSWFEETHCLRNRDTLIFINRPYRNATRLDTTPN
jgi:ferric-dicitrate binding protein FerR (iron transport regulator)